MTLPPTFTIHIGSIGRPSLEATMDSFANQARTPGDEMIVCFDAHEMSANELSRNMARVHRYENFGIPIRAVSHVGINTDSVDKVYENGTIVGPGQPYHWLGVEQINFALRTVPTTGSHFTTIGDDDCLVGDYFQVLRAYAAEYPLRPLLYRFSAPWREILWDRPRMRECHISGCCILAPRPFVGYHHTRLVGTHDFDWMERILASAGAAGQAPLWIDYVGVVARPRPQEQHLLSPGHYGPAAIVEAVAPDAG